MAMRIHQPIPETAGRVVTPDGTVEVLPYQIVVMVSIAATRVIALPADARRLTGWGKFPLVGQAVSLER
jgi:hypothetical protein